MPAPSKNQVEQNQYQPLCDALIDANAKLELMLDKPGSLSPSAVGRDAYSKFCQSYFAISSTKHPMLWNAEGVKRVDDIVTYNTQLPVDVAFFNQGMIDIGFRLPVPFVVNPTAGGIGLSIFLNHSLAFTPSSIDYILNMHELGHIRDYDGLNTILPKLGTNTAVDPQKLNEVFEKITPHATSGERAKLLSIYTLEGKLTEADKETDGSYRLSRVNDERIRLLFGVEPSKVRTMVREAQAKEPSKELLAQAPHLTNPPPVGMDLEVFLDASLNNILAALRTITMLEQSMKLMSPEERNFVKAVIDKMFPSGLNVKTLLEKNHNEFVAFHSVISEAYRYGEEMFHGQNPEVQKTFRPFELINGQESSLPPFNFTDKNGNSQNLSYPLNIAFLTETGLISGYLDPQKSANLNPKSVIRNKKGEVIELKYPYIDQGKVVYKTLDAKYVTFFRILISASAAGRPDYNMVPWPNSKAPLKK